MENYLIIENNVVTNIVVWDGISEDWTPPQGATVIPLQSVPALVWIPDMEIKDFVLIEIMGAGSIGFTWDGSVLTTNEPKPVYPNEIESTTV